MRDIEILFLKYYGTNGFELGLFQAWLNYFLNIFNCLCIVYFILVKS